MGIRFMVVLAALAWHCCAIEISPDTVFTSTNTVVGNASGDTGPQFIIRNTNMVDTVLIDTMYFYKLSSVGFFGGGITFNDTAHHCKYTVIPARVNDSFFIATSRIGYPYQNCNNYYTKFMVLPKDSLVLTNPVLWALTVAALAKEQYIIPGTFILKVIFIPDIGAKDSVIFIGPQVTTGTKFGTKLKGIAAPNKQTGVLKLYDLSGRCVDKMTSRKNGVYIAAYGRQGGLTKKLMIGD